MAVNAAQTGFDVAHSLLCPLGCGQLRLAAPCGAQTARTADGLLLPPTYPPLTDPALSPASPPPQPATAGGDDPTPMNPWSMIVQCRRRGRRPAPCTPSPLRPPVRVRQDTALRVAPVVGHVEPTVQAARAHSWQWPPGGGRSPTSGPGRSCSSEPSARSSRPTMSSSAPPASGRAGQQPVAVGRPHATGAAWGARPARARGVEAPLVIGQAVFGHFGSAARTSGWL